MRSSTLKSNAHGSDALDGVMRAHPNMTFRHVIKQSKRATGSDELDFSNKVTGPLQEAGKKDALAALGLDTSIIPEEQVEQESKVSTWYALLQSKFDRD